MKHLVTLALVVIAIYVGICWYKNKQKKQILTTNFEGGPTKQDGLTSNAADLRGDLRTAQDYLYGGFQKIGTIYSPTPILKSDGSQPVISESEFAASHITSNPSVVGMDNTPSIAGVLQKTLATGISVPLASDNGIIPYTLSSNNPYQDSSGSSWSNVYVSPGIWKWTNGSISYFGDGAGNKIGSA